MKVWQNTDGARNVPRQAVVCKAEEAQLRLRRPVEQALGHRPAQVIPAEDKKPNALQIAELVWDFTGEVVGVEIEDLELGEVAERGRDDAREIVAGEIEGKEAWQLPETGWNLPCERGVAEVKDGEERQVAELGRQGTDQLHAGERQSRDAQPVAVAAGDADPAAVRRAGRPVAAEDAARVGKPVLEGEEGREVVRGVGCRDGRWREQ